jgi:membrane-associated protein
MELLSKLLNILMHLDEYLTVLVQDYGVWVYAILFVIIFCETGLVVTPFLPGDSLLFAVGALGAAGSLDPVKAGLAMLAAAVLGDTVNYWVGKLAGQELVRLFPRLIKRKHLDRTHAFFERYGGKTIVLARFVPIVRTLAPFVAGMGTMHYRRFMVFNVTGALGWVGLIIPAGYWFGNIPIVKRNFELVVVGIIAVSMLPMLIEYLRARRQQPTEHRLGSE